MGDLDIQDLLPEIGHLLKELLNDNDRAAALVGSQFLDNYLERGLRAIIVDVKDRRLDSLFKFPNALSSFSARIDIAFAFGILSNEVFKELHLIRDIRNKFAHQLSAISFEDEEVSDLCKRLQLRSIFDDDKFQKIGLDAGIMLRLTAQLGLAVLNEDDLKVDAFKILKTDASSAASNKEAFIQTIFILFLELTLLLEMVERRKVPPFKPIQPGLGSNNSL